MPASGRRASSTWWGRIRWWWASGSCAAGDKGGRRFLWSGGKFFRRLPDLRHHDRALDRRARHGRGELERKPHVALKRPAFRRIDGRGSMWDQPDGHRERVVAGRSQAGNQRKPIRAEVVPYGHAGGDVRRRTHRPRTAPLLDGDLVVRAHGRRRLGCVGDRKSTRLNSSHMSISYAVFCLKKKKKKTNKRIRHIKQ